MSHLITEDIVTEEVEIFKNYEHNTGKTMIWYDYDGKYRRGFKPIVDGNVIYFNFSFEEEGTGYNFFEEHDNDFQDVDIDDDGDYGKLIYENLYYKLYSYYDLYLKLEEKRYRR